MQITQLLSLQMEAASLPVALQMKKISREKKRLSPAKGHVCIWNASTRVKSSKWRVPITVAFLSQFVTTRVWRLGASIASLPKPKKSLPASQYTSKILSCTFFYGFLFAVAITLPNVTSWLKTLISVQIPALIRNGTLKPATSASPEAKTTTRVRPLKKSLLLPSFFFVADAVAKERKKGLLIRLSGTGGRME